jgi:hypothetical protein
MTTTILSIFLGIGLASASGFRVFLPLFVLSLASYFHVWEINATFDWIGKLPALIMLGIAMVAEIFAYYIPIVDNFLDTIAAPLAAIAGTIIMASTVIDLEPIMTWSLALIAGGGTATAMQGMTTLTRFTSTLKTGGLANPIVTTAETGTSIFLSVLSIFAPIIVVVIVLILLFIAYKMYKKIKR